MKNRYEKYSTKQFLNDPFFIEWIKSGTPEADVFWNEWLSERPENLAAFQEAELQLRAMLSAVRFELEKKDSEEVWQRIEHSIHREAGVVRIRSIISWVTAAAVVLFLAGGTWYFLNTQSGGSVLTQNTGMQDSITPGGNRAVLTLSDGTRVVLDSANTGAISQQGKITVVKLKEGELSYEAGSANKIQSEVVYNTICTPRGGQYQLILSDGTKVWLNAESSLRYPVLFGGEARSVELTGEGYFEVAHKNKLPFHVRAGSVDVKVLGTHFNVNAYGNESAINTTLLEGSIAVSVSGKTATLKPGEQARFQIDNQEFQTLTHTDLDQIIAWKNGYFSFRNTSLKEVMRQIERWYNVAVQYDGIIEHRKFGGGIERSAQLSDVLQILEESNVHFKLKGRKLIVKR